MLLLDQQQQAKCFLGFAFQLHLCPEVCNSKRSGCPVLVSPFAFLFKQNAFLALLSSFIFSSFRLWISICRSALPLLCFCKAFWVETELQFTAANGELWTSDLLTLLTKSCLTMPLEQRFQFPSGCCQISTTEFGL